MFTELNNDQARHVVDLRQVFEEWEICRSNFGHQYSGSMRWVERKGYPYLLKKDGRQERSLGRRDAETEAAYEAFIEGRKTARDRLASLDQRLDEMAPVCRALRLNRVPIITARVLRHLGEAGLLGQGLVVAGTTSLFLYESMAAVQLEGGLLATGDVDLLWDARRSLRLAGLPVRDEGFLALLRRADRSFKRVPRGPFRAVNRDGFMIDLIRPLNARPDDADLDGAEITGLDWLVNAPKVNDVAVAQDGRPVRIWAVDPRVFALHKVWLSGRDDREPVKRGRDRAQANAAAALAARFGLDMRDPILSSMPAPLRASIVDLEHAVEGARS